jgi:hypothetical protein
MASASAMVRFGSGPACSVAIMSFRGPPRNPAGPAAALEPGALQTSHYPFQPRDPAPFGHELARAQRSIASVYIGRTIYAGLTFAAHLQRSRPASGPERPTPHRKPLWEASPSDFALHPTPGGLHRYDRHHALAIPPPIRPPQIEPCCLPHKLATFSSLLKNGTGSRTSARKLENVECRERACPIFQRAARRSQTSRTKIKAR